MMKASKWLIGLGLFGFLHCGGSETETSSEPELAELQLALIGARLPGLNAAQRTAFDDGAEAFAEEEGVADGLGPVFNERACGNCHVQGALGGAGANFEVRAGRQRAGAFDPLVEQGGSLFDLFSVTSLDDAERTAIPDCGLPENGEPVPADANVIAPRRTTALFGLGLVEATSDTTFRLLAATQPSAIRGRVARVDDLTNGGTATGKFGWKAQVSNLDDFAGDAYLNEMGITSPLFLSEQAPSGSTASLAACDIVAEPEDDGEDVELFAQFMRFLAPPPRLPLSPQALLGSGLFTVVGCDGCHTRRLVTGVNAVSALSVKAYEPFSDFLLHDMGDLGDGIVQGAAGAREMRTAPLWGLRFVPPENLLHDGRASSVSDAILRHDGQARASRDAFAALPTASRNAVVAFLNTL